MVDLEFEFWQDIFFYLEKGEVAVQGMSMTQVYCSNYKSQQQVNKTSEFFKHSGIQECMNTLGLYLQTSSVMESCKICSLEILKGLKKVYYLYTT